MDEKDKQLLLDLAKKNKFKYKLWNLITPNTDRTQQDLMSAIQNEELRINRVPAAQWEKYKENTFNKDSLPGGVGLENVGGWMTGDRKWINIPDNAPNETIDHELLHYFSTHSPSDRGAPNKINPYIQADMELGGWLPSLHPNAARPTLSGDNILSRFWNKNIASNALNIDRDAGYHPWTGQSAFNRFTGSDGHDHGYNPPPAPEAPPIAPPEIEPQPIEESPVAQSFGSAFKQARFDGLDEFEWDGKKYHTKTKEEMEYYPTAEELQEVHPENLPSYPTQEEASSVHPPDLLRMMIKRDMTTSVPVSETINRGLLNHLRSF